MKHTLIILSLVIGVNSLVTAQYFGGKTIPDTNIDQITTIKDESYLLSTTITAKEMGEHLNIIASDDFQGRETGSEGIDKAANYISDALSDLRLPMVGENESFFQSVAFTFSSWGDINITLGDKSYRHLWDYIAFPNTSVDQEMQVDEVIFAGYGISTNEYDDYAGKDVKGKVAIVFDGSPTGDMAPESAEGYKMKSKVASLHGAKMLIIISNDIKKVIDANRRMLVNRVTELGDHTDLGADHINAIVISSTMAKDLFGDAIDDIINNRDSIKATGKPQKEVSVKTDLLTINQNVDKQVLHGKNILGYIEGSDLKDELIIVSAHYDHVGTKGDEVYNGADDNGSGSTTVLEIAEALATAKAMKKGPRRSVLCLWMTGEEKGLLGSEYYVNNPIFPIESTVADVNIDMVGRWGEEYLSQERPYIYIIGSDRLSSELHEISESANDKYSRMILDYKYNDANDPNRFYFRSDHYNFAKNGIPAIFYFNGVHKDYHRLTDSVEKIDFDLMEDRGRLIFHTIWQLANQDKRIEVDKE